MKGSWEEAAVIFLISGYISKQVSCTRRISHRLGGNREPGVENKKCGCLCADSVSDGGSFLETTISFEGVLKVEKNNKGATD